VEVEVLTAKQAAVEFIKVIIFLVLLAIVLIVFHYVMEYHAAVVQSLNLTGKVVLNGTAVP
jgi:hypothetical protein